MESVVDSSLLFIGVLLWKVFFYHKQEISGKCRATKYLANLNQIQNIDAISSKTP
jgi:hypothetical protein